MRRFFIKGGHVAGVEELLGVTAAQAIEMAHKLYEARKEEFEGFEVWDGDRAMSLFPEPQKASAWCGKRLRFKFNPLRPKALL
jgi:hypothetical protein